MHTFASPSKVDELPEVEEVKVLVEAFSRCWGTRIKSPTPGQRSKRSVVHRKAAQA